MFLEFYQFTEANQKVKCIFEYFLFFTLLLLLLLLLLWLLLFLLLLILPSRQFEIKIIALFFLACSIDNIVWSMLHHGSVEWVRNEECFFIFSYTFKAVFYQKCSVFIIVSFYWLSITFPRQNLTIQKQDSFSFLYKKKTIDVDFLI